MNNISTSALLITMTLVLLLSACSTASKYEPAPAAAAPMAPMYEPKPDRN
jgi:predicted component of type VI protein secretion system